MKQFIIFCLLIVPAAFAASALPPTPSPDAPSLSLLKSDRELEEEIYENITRQAKPVFIPPGTPNENGEHGPVHVTVDTHVRDILDIKTVDTNIYDWTVDLIVRQNWNDPRLAYDVSHHPNIKLIALTTAVGQKSIWKPDTFFSGTVKGDFHFVLSPNAVVWVFPNGDVRYSVRVSITFRCKPLDHVAEEGDKADLVCPMRIASYGITADKLVYEWAKEEPVQLIKDMYLPHYNLDKVTTEAKTGKSRIGEWSSLFANFHFSNK